jgi:hypothetical protein
MILAIPDMDIKGIRFRDVKRDLEQIILGINKISFLTFFDSDLRVGFITHDNGDDDFIKNYSNIYPVRYERYEYKESRYFELFFTRNAMFPINPGIDILSYLANLFELRKKGYFRIDIKRSQMPLINLKKYMVKRELKKRHITKIERAIGEGVIEKLSSPIYSVRIFTSDPWFFNVTRDQLTGQALALNGKKIYMCNKEISYFIHFPLSNIKRRRPW